MSEELGSMNTVFASRGANETLIPPTVQERADEEDVQIIRTNGGNWRGPHAKFAGKSDTYSS
jgi:hypothetical protein